MGTSLTDTDLRQFEATLLQRRGALRAALLEQTRAGTARGAGTAAVEVHDLKDEAFAHLLANLANTELTHLRDELVAIGGALQRIATGGYGICVDCGREVGRERLLVQPSAERCLGCQASAERTPAVRAASSPALQPGAAAPPRR